MRNLDGNENLCYFLPFVTAEVVTYQQDGASAGPRSNGVFCLWQRDPIRLRV